MGTLLRRLDGWSAGPKVRDRAARSGPPSAEQAGSGGPRQGDAALFQIVLRTQISSGRLRLARRCPQDARAISNGGGRVIRNAQFRAAGGEVVNVDGQPEASSVPQPILPSGRALDIFAIRPKHLRVVPLEQKASRQKYQRRTRHQAMDLLLAALDTKGDAFRLDHGPIVDGASGVHSDITVARRLGSRTYRRRCLRAFGIFQGMRTRRQGGSWPRRLCTPREREGRGGGLIPDRPHKEKGASTGDEAPMRRGGGGPAHQSPSGGNRR